jgi:hypothetical protein
MGFASYIVPLCWTVSLNDELGFGSPSELLAHRGRANNHCSWSSYHRRMWYCTKLNAAEKSLSSEKGKERA